MSETTQLRVFASFLARKAVILGFSLAISSSLLLAGSRDLYKKPTRPTVKEFLNAELDPRDPNVPLPAHHPDFEDTRVDIKPWLEVFKKGLPRLMAQFERLFPGARYVFIGRDVAAFADVFEHFYNLRGDYGRILRAGASRSSFWHNANSDNLPKVDPKVLNEYLRTLGVDIDHLERDRPVVFIDTLSYGGGRQGKLLVAAIYHEWIRKGRDPALLADRVNMLGLAGSTYSGKHQDVFSQVKPLIDNRRKLWKQAAGIMRGDIDFNELWKVLASREGLQRQEIAVIPQAREHFHESSYGHWIGVWHKAYGGLVRDSDGVVATPGEPQPESVRKSVIWVMQKLLQYVGSDYFHELVESEAENIGYQFPPAKKDAEAELRVRQGSSQEAWIYTEERKQLVSEYVKRIFWTSRQSHEVLGGNWHQRLEHAESTLKNHGEWSLTLQAFLRLAVFKYMMHENPEADISSSLLPKMFYDLSFGESQEFLEEMLKLAEEFSFVRREILAGDWTLDAHRYPTLQKARLALVADRKPEPCQYSFQ